MSSVPAAYEADLLLGTGGLGRVYRAHHLPSGQKVALKTLHAGSSRAETYGLLVREAAAAAQLRHPNVVELLDFVVEDGRPYLVLELVEGYDIEAWVDVWPGWPTVSTALEQTLDGLAAAHAAGIVHRDLKPANLLWSESAGVKITDFGMAEVVDPLAAEGDRLFGGTPLYMAPEQLDPTGHQGPWTDLYAFGAVLYVLLTGKEPIGPDQDWKAAKLLPPPTFKARSGLLVPEGLGRLVEALLDPAPGRRPRFAAEVRTLLGVFGQGVQEKGIVLAAGVPSSRRGSTTLASAPTAAAIRITTGPDGAPTTAASWRSSDLASAPTAASSPTSGEKPLSATTSSPEIPSRTRWTVPAPPPAEVPFRISAPAELAASTSLLQLRPPPLVGRRHERQLLTSLIEDVVANRKARTLVLVGEAGVGKSRLARWALGEVERSGMMEGTAAGYDVSGTTDGLRRALRRLLGPAPAADRTDPRPQSWQRLGLERSELDREKLYTWLEAPAGGTALSLSERIAVAFEVLSWVGRVRPVYLWLDDVAWSHDGALELAERMLSANHLPVALVMTVRAGAAEHPAVRRRLAHLERLPRASQHRVERLDVDGRRELIETAAPVAPEVATWMAQHVDETPLVLVQLARELTASGKLLLRTGGYGPPDGESMRGILQALSLTHLLAERGRKLLATFGESAANAEAVLVRIALLGPRIEERALRATLADDPSQRLATVVLGRGLLHGILRLEPGGAYRFEHDLIRDAVLERLPLRRDADETLASVARGLLATYGDERWGVRVRAAQLFEQGNQVDEALLLVLGSVLDVGLLNDIERAQDLLSTAASWVDKHPTAERRARLLFVESETAYYASDYQRALELGRRAKALAIEAQAKQLAIACLTGEASILFYLRRLGESERAAHEALSQCSLDDPATAEAGLNASHRLAEIAVLRGDFAKGREYYDLAIRFAVGERLVRRENHLVIDQVELDLLRGDLDSASARLAPLLELAKGPNVGQWGEIAEFVSLRLEVRRGNGAAVADQIAEWVNEYERRNDPWRTTGARMVAALAAAQTGDRERGRDEARAFVRAFDAYPHEKPFTLWGLEELPRLLTELGLPDEAASVRACGERLRREIAAGFAE